MSTDIFLDPRRHVYLDVHNGEQCLAGLINDGKKKGTRWLHDVYANTVLFSFSYVIGRCFRNNTTVVNVASPDQYPDFRVVISKKITAPPGTKFVELFLPYRLGRGYWEAGEEEESDQDGEFQGAKQVANKTKSSTRYSSDAFAAAAATTTATAAAVARDAATRAAAAVARDARTQKRDEATAAAVAAAATVTVADAAANAATGEDPENGAGSELGGGGGGRGGGGGASGAAAISGPGSDLGGVGELEDGGGDGGSVDNDMAGSELGGGGGGAPISGLGSELGGGGGCGGSGGAEAGGELEDGGGFAELENGGGGLGGGGDGVASGAAFISGAGSELGGGGEEYYNEGGIGGEYRQRAAAMQFFFRTLSKNGVVSAETAAVVGQLIKALDPPTSSLPVGVERSFLSAEDVRIIRLHRDLQASEAAQAFLSVIMVEQQKKTVALREELSRAHALTSAAALSFSYVSGDGGDGGADGDAGAVDGALASADASPARRSPAPAPRATVSAPAPFQSPAPAPAQFSAHGSGSGSGDGSQSGCGAGVGVGAGAGVGDGAGAGVGIGAGADVGAGAASSGSGGGSRFGSGASTRARSSAADRVAAREAAAVAAQTAEKDYQLPRSPLPRTRVTEEAVLNAVLERNDRLWPILDGVLKDVAPGFLQRLSDHINASSDMVKTYHLPDKEEAYRFLFEARSDKNVRVAVFPSAVFNFGDGEGYHGDVLGFLEHVADPNAVALSSPSSADISKRGADMRSRTPKQLREHVEEHGGIFVYGAPIALKPEKNKGVNGLGLNGFNCFPPVNAALCGCSPGVAVVTAAMDISSASSREHVFADSTGATQLSLYGNDGGGYTSFHMDTATTKRDGQDAGLPGQLRKAGILPMVTYKDGSTVDGLDSFNNIIGNKQAVGDVSYRRTRWFHCR